MSTRKLVPKYRTAKFCGQHRCDTCGKDLPTAAGLKRHIANSSRCYKQWRRWEREVLQREPTKSPSPCVSNATDDSQGPQYDSPALDFPPEELPAFIPLERVTHHTTLALRDSSSSDSEPLSKRAQVEEDEGEKTDGCRRWVHEFDGAAKELGEGKTLFKEIQEQQEAMHKPLMAPFADNDEWELARWLMKNVTQTATEEFLKLKAVRHS
jgi:hypothetical protein